VRNTAGSLRMLLVPRPPTLRFSVVAGLTSQHRAAEDVGIHVGTMLAEPVGRRQSILPVSE
jgi:hypothetical protein